MIPIEGRGICFPVWKYLDMLHAAAALSVHQQKATVDWHMDRLALWREVLRTVREEDRTRQPALLLAFSFSLREVKPFKIQQGAS